MTASYIVNAFHTRVCFSEALIKLATVTTFNKIFPCLVFCNPESGKQITNMIEKYLTIKIHLLTNSIPHNNWEGLRVQLDCDEPQ